jgi:predicted GNAT family N-acyltransferase
MSTPTTVTTAIGPSYHTVTLPDGTITKYLLRGLRRTTTSYGDNNDKNDNEDSNNINEWTNFCALAFAHKKPTPPSAMYFLRHYNNDPRRDANLVRVMVSLSNPNEEAEMEMASSVRIFRRTLSSGPGGSSSSLTYEAGGIGEVCTSPNHRRRGLSTILLHNALTIMQHDNSNNSDGMSCSLLHASPDFRPYYTKVGGYQSIRSLWSIVPIVYTNLISTIITTTNDTIINNAKRFSVRRAIYPQDASRLFQLYQLYSEQRLVTIVRSLEYWEKYVSVELSNSLWVLT